VTGRLYGVGVGPGDPELVTIKAARLIAAADVVAYHAGVGKRSNARRIAAGFIPAGAIEEELRYPVTTGSTDHPGGYAGAMAEFYEACAQRLAAHLDAGRSVVVLAEGDPMFYGSFMYMHDRLSDRFETEVVPGVPAFAAATAVAAEPLVRQTDVLTILPGTLPEPELARRLADTDGAIIMKLGRTFPAVRSALLPDHRPGPRWSSSAEERGAYRGHSPRTARRRARPRTGRLAHARGRRGTGRGRARRRLRAVRGAGAAAGRAAAACVGQHRRDRPGPPRTRPRAQGRAGGRRLGR
jgi:precorrin-2 C(20)-methyltransferase